MIVINPKRALRGEVLRLVTTRDAGGDVIDESFQEIVGKHWVDLQNFSANETIANEQLQTRFTHWIFPEFNVMPYVTANDYYRIDGDKLYRIIEPIDFRTLGYFKVLEGAFGFKDEAGVFKRFYSFDNVPPGVYTFGAGILAAVPAFEVAPDIFTEAISDSDTYIPLTSITTSGFTIIDRASGGASALVRLYIWEKVAAGVNVTRWSFSGLGEGTYVYGTAPLAPMPAGFDMKPILLDQLNNDSSYYITDSDKNGFKIVWRGEGQPPSVSVMIIKQ